MWRIVIFAKHITDKYRGRGLSSCTGVGSFCFSAVAAIEWRSLLLFFFVHSTSYLWCSLGYLIFLGWFSICIRLFIPLCCLAADLIMYNVIGWEWVCYTFQSQCILYPPAVKLECGLSSNEFCAHVAIKRMYPAAQLSSAFY